MPISDDVLHIASARDHAMQHLPDYPNDALNSLITNLENWLGASDDGQWWLTAGGLRFLIAWPAEKSAEEVRIWIETACAILICAASKIPIKTS